MLKYYSTLLLCFALTSVKAQLEFPASFIQLLEEAQLTINQPIENQFKEKSVRDNDLCSYQYSMRKKKGDLEIRYNVQPSAAQDSNINAVPHITALSLVSSLATNDDDSIISYHQVSKKDLETKYRANWGLVAFFKPKEEFSSKAHCKMLTLYAEDKAIVTIFYLFDEITEDLENQKYSIMFKPSRGGE